MISAFGVEHTISKSFLSSGPKKALEMTAVERRALRMSLDSPRPPGVLPGLGKGSGLGTAKKSQGGYFNKIGRKEVRRQSRIRQGQVVSPVRRRV